jgi:hypothetical protein
MDRSAARSRTAESSFGSRPRYFNRGQEKSGLTGQLHAFLQNLSEEARAQDRVVLVPSVRSRSSTPGIGCVFRPIWALVPAGIWAVIPEDLGTLSERSDGSVRIGAKRRVEVKQLVGAGR